MASLFSSFGYVFGSLEVIGPPLYFISRQQYHFMFLLKKLKLFGENMWKLTYDN